MTLSSRQRAHLRSLAHRLKPVVHVGHEGLTDSAVRSVQEAFNTRELLKIRVAEAAPLGARKAGEAIAARIDGAEPVQTIGRTVVLYRRHPETPEIRLPPPGGDAPAAGTD